MKKEEWKIPLYKIYTDDEDVNLITNIVKRGNKWALGPEIEEFENELKNYVGTDYCLTLNSGTSALHATYLAYGFGQGDNIILPSFTFIATANSTLFVNAKPNVSDRLFKFFLPVSVHSRFPTVNNSGFIFIISFI